MRMKRLRMRHSDIYLRARHEGSVHMGPISGIAYVWKFPLTIPGSAQDADSSLFNGKCRTLNIVSRVDS